MYISFAACLTVYAARNLQPKKGEGVCNASVIFGVGKEKFRTDGIRDNNPTWNEESIIKVGKAAPLLFTLYDRDDLLGTVSVPLAQVPSAAHRRRWMPLANKKGPSIGDLCFDCWVLSFRASTTKWSFKSSWLPSSIVKDRTKRRQSIELASVSLKGSHSVENLYSIPELKTLEPLQQINKPAIRRVSSVSTFEQNRPTDPPPRITLAPPPLPVPPPPVEDEPPPPTSVKDAKMKFAFSFKPRLTPTLGQIMSVSGSPEITVLTPKSGPASGGTRVTIRGVNLGNSKDDILSLSVNGSDIRRTLEWHSSAKITCTTKPWGGSGPVVIVTKSGGRTTSNTSYTFQEEKKEKTKDSKVPRQQLLEELTRLRLEMHGLVDENKAMKIYIDRIMVLLMEKYPQVLDDLCKSRGTQFMP